MTSARKPPDRIRVEWCPECGAVSIAWRERQTPSSVKACCGITGRFLIRYQLAERRGGTTKRAKKGAKR